MSSITVGIDLAKNVYAVHGVDDNGKAALVKPKMPRAKLLELTTGLVPCPIVMEACFGVRLIAPKFAAPYRMSGKRGKNDAADAAAICEAMSRPNI